MVLYLTQLRVSASVVLVSTVLCYFHTPKHVVSLCPLMFLFWPLSIPLFWRAIFLVIFCF